MAIAPREWHTKEDFYNHISSFEMRKFFAAYGTKVERYNYSYEYGHFWVLHFKKHDGTPGLKAGGRTPDEAMTNAFVAFCKARLTNQGQT